ncbi:MAG: Flp pilus assembly protein CpaB [Paracoccaceae bacterium]
MRTMFGLVLVIGLALASFAVYMANNYFSQTQAALIHERELRSKTGPLVEVYVVNKAKNYGDMLTKDDVQLIYWPQDALPDHIFMDAATLFPDDGKTPRYVMRQMEKFEPVLAEKVTEPGQMAGLTGQLAKGQRAFAIKVDVASGVSGFVQPGDRVDVYWTGTIDSNNGDMTRLIESGVKIIAVDQTADGGNGSAVVARTVTVSASPEQVARLAQAAATGKLALSLVGTTDASVADANGKIEVDSNGLLGITEQQVAAVPEAPKVCSIKTRKGADVADTPIPCTN